MLEKAEEHQIWEEECKQKEEETKERRSIENNVISNSMNGIMYRIVSSSFTKQFVMKQMN